MTFFFSQVNPDIGVTEVSTAGTDLLATFSQSHLSSLITMSPSTDSPGLMGEIQEDEEKDGIRQVEDPRNTCANASQKWPFCQQMDRDCFGIIGKTSQRMSKGMSRYLVAFLIYAIPEHKKWWRS